MGGIEGERDEGRGFEGGWCGQIEGGLFLVPTLISSTRWNQTM